MLEKLETAIGFFYLLKMTQGDKSIHKAANYVSN